MTTSLGQESAVPYLDHIYVWRNNDGTLAKPDDEWVSNQQQLTASAVEELIESLPNDDSGIDTQRIGEFLLEQNMRRTMHKVISPEYVEEIEERSGLVIDSSGTHFILANLVVVVKKDDPLLTEAVIVHEQGHANKLPTVLYYSGKNYIDMTPGFAGFEDMTSEKGTLYEEGFASHLEHDYILKNTGSQGLSGQDRHREIKVGSDVYKIPSNYFLEANGRPRLLSDSVLASYTMSLLFAKDLKIHQAMHDSRHEPDALDEFRQRVDALYPGLHNWLNDRKYDIASFANAVAVVVDTLYRGKHKKAANIVKDLELELAGY